MILVRLSLPTLALVLLVPAVALAQTSPTLDVDLGGGAKLSLVLVPHGTFTQGSPPAEAGRSEDERAHRVTLGNDVYIGKFPVTRGQFARFVAATGYKTESEKGTSGGSGWDGTALVQRREFTWQSPGFAQTDEHPVTLVTYDDALAFTGWLTRTAGRAFTLPTEAQWEHAYRAGSTGAYYAYAGKSEGEATAIGWFKVNAGNGTRPVGQKAPNALGLFDLGGNVNQWCLDWYAPYVGDNLVDPVATTPDASDKPRRVLRGGSWLKDAKSGRAAARYRNTPGSRNADNGFRVVAATTASVAAARAPLTSPTSTPPPSTPPPPPARGSSGEDHTVLGAVVIGGFCFGTLAFIGLIVSLIFKSRKTAGSASPPVRIGHRLGGDGFWIDAPGHTVGSLVSYRYRDQNAQIHEGQVRVEGAPSGQYVYTGHAPLAMLSLQMIEVARAQQEQQRSSRSSYSSSSQSSSQRRYGATSSQSNDDSTFRGYPSAY
jgi:formylglycine-generating enzyme required for sulfatase activity